MTCIKNLALETSEVEPEQVLLVLGEGAERDSGVSSWYVAHGGGDGCSVQWVASLCHFRNPGSAAGCLQVKFKEVEALQPVVEVHDHVQCALCSTGCSAIVCFVHAFEALTEVRNEVTAEMGIVNVI